MLDWLMVIGGLALLFAGGESLVRGAVGLSRRFGVSELLIGLTVVGFGTSMPELLVSAGAALSNKPDIALGNVIGSNTANVLLILGLSALIAPISGWDRSVRRDAIVMVGAALLVVSLSLFGVVTSASGIAMIMALGAYLVFAFRQSERELADEGHVEEQMKLAWLVVITLSGLAGLFAGAYLLVEGATAIAMALGVSQAVIGLTIVAVGTSLPELATSLVAAIRRNSAVSIGNIVGSNIFNILGILGITALLAPVPISTQMRIFDIPIMLATGILLAAILLLTGRISRLAGGAMLAAYAGYTVWLFLR